MSHLADLHEAGRTLAGGPPFDDKLRGLSIMRATPEEARGLVEQDPAVRIGRFSVKAIPWLVPTDAMHFARTRFPRSVAEVQGEYAPRPGLPPEGEGGLLV